MVDQLKQVIVDKDLLNKFKPSEIINILPTKQDIDEFRAFM